MGHKSGEKGKRLSFYLAFGCLVTALTIASCAPVQDRIVEMRAHQQLEEYREQMAAGFFETIIAQSNLVLAETETAPPAAAALYALGEVYAHPDYAGRDYSVSQNYFEKLIERFPDSSLASEAKTYINLFETIEAKEKAAALATAEKKSLQQEISAQKETAPEKAIVPEKTKKPALVAEPGKIVENRNFEEAIRRNMRILEEAGTEKPADQALYNLGLIFAHVDNPAKDFKKSQVYFHVLTKQFPESPLAEEAQIWLGLFETLEKIQQIDIEIEQQKKELTR